MAYEIFDKKGKHTGQPLTVRCGTHSLFLSNSARALITTTHVVLLWDADAGRAAIQETKPADGQGRQLGKGLGCRAFLQETGLFNVGQLPVTWNEESRMIEWDIPKKPKDAK